MPVITKNEVKVSLSIVSLLACFAMNQAVYAEGPHANVHAHLPKISIKLQQQPSRKHAKKLSLKKLKDDAKVNAPVTTKPGVDYHPAHNVKPFKLKPRFNIWGISGDRTLTKGQFLIPLYGNAGKVFYLATAGSYMENDSSWTGSAGPGYRQVVGEHIWGIYALTSYVRTPHNGFIVINPGLEMLGAVWDMTVNGYVPVGNKKKLGQEGWAGDDFGEYNYAHATGHNYYDHRLQRYEEPGRGVGIDLARVVPYFDDAKFHVGAYHLDTASSGSNNGVSSKLTYDLNKYTALEVEDCYDTTNRNVFTIGIRFSSGGYSKEEKKQIGIANRLLDPIENGATTHPNVLINSKKTVDLGNHLEHDNVWYYKTGDATGNPTQQGSGTYEDPFIGFNEANYAVVVANQGIGVLDTHPLLYFAPGEYSFAEFSSRGIDSRFNLPNGWGMYGRSASYLAPAMNSDRANFAGGLDLNYGAGTGTDTTTLNSIRITNNVTGTSSDVGNQNAALYIANANDVQLRNTAITNAITVSDTDSANYFVTGLYATNSQVTFATLNQQDAGTNNILASWSFENNGDLDHASINGTVYGIYANNSVVNFNGGSNSVAAMGSFSSNNIDNDNNSSTITQGINAYGIDASSSMVNFNGGSNSIAATGNFSYNDIFNDTNEGTIIQSTNAYGLYANNSTVNFNGGFNSITTAGDFFSNDPERTNSNEINAGTITQNANAHGIDANSSAVKFNGGSNSIAAIGNFSLSDVINVGNKDSITQSADAYGIYANNYNTVIINGGSNSFSAVSSFSSSPVDDDNHYNSATINQSADAYGIYTNDNSAVTFNGGSNSIYATGNFSSDGKIYNDTSTATDVITQSANAYGIYASNNSNVTFNGGSNSVFAVGNFSSGEINNENNAGTITQGANAYGIYANNESTVSFIKGSNFINATGNFTSGEINNENNTGTITQGANAYGIYAASSIINFANQSTNPVSIYASATKSVSGNNDVTHTKYGIYGDNNSNTHIQIGGTDISTAADIKNYVNFDSSGSGDDNSKALLWNDISLDWE